MLEVDLILQPIEVERLQCKSSPHFRVMCCTQLPQSPAVGLEFANLDKSVLILESDDGSIGTKVALVIHGR